MTIYFVAKFALFKGERWGWFAVTEGLIVWPNLMCWYGHLGIAGRGDGHERRDEHALRRSRVGATAIKRVAALRLRDRLAQGR